MPAQESHITSDGAFLMEQIELREALSELNESADPLAALDNLRSDVESKYLNSYRTSFKPSI